MIPSGISPNCRPSTSADVGVYLDVINPYVIEQGDMLNMRPGSQDYVRLYRHLETTFSQESSWPDMVASGDFNELHCAAKELANDVQDITSVDFTVPYAFGVHSVVSMMAGFNDTRFGQEELPTAATMTSYFLSQFASHLALRMPDAAFAAGPDIGHLAERVNKRSVMLSTRLGFDPDWLRTRSTVLAERMLFRHHLDRVITQEPLVEVTDMDELRRGNDTLFSGLQRIGMYTVRPEIYQGHQSNWDIIDTLSIRHMQLAKGQNRQVRPAEWPGAFMTAFEVPVGVAEESGGLHLTKDINSINISGRGLFAHMDGTGHLSADLYGAMPLSDLYEKAGKLENYEVLRQFFMERYFDQSMPEDIVQAAREDTKRQLGSADPGYDREAGKVDSGLLSARLQRLKAYAER